MTKALKTVALCALVATVGAVSADAAVRKGKRVRAACESDYASLCSQYDPNSSAVARCFEANRNRLSNGCIRALIDAGDVPRRFLR